MPRTDCRCYDGDEFKNHRGTRGQAIHCLHSLVQTGKYLYMRGFCARPMAAWKVQQIERRALRKLKKALEAYGIRPGNRVHAHLS